MKQSLILNLFILVICITGSMSAQQKLTKVSQTIKVNKEVTIDLNTSYCNIVFDTWNKNVVEIEAYIEGEKLSKEELQEALKDWKVDIDATDNLVTISARGGAAYAWAHKYEGGEEDAVNAVLQELKFELADLPEMNFDFNFEMPKMPQIPEMPKMPELPELPEGISKIDFDYDAYKKNGDAYMEQWSKNFESKFGKDYAKKMEAWGEEFGKEWEEKYGKEMEKWGEKFGKEWEAKYGKQMEEWGERFAKQMEERAIRIEEQGARVEERVAEREKMIAEREKQTAERSKLAEERRAKIDKMMNNNSSKVKRTIKIKMPKDAKLKVNVKYGELKFAANVDNLKADLSHSKLIANSINGSKTSINASYSPIYVTYWNLGALNLNYVKNAEIDHVKSVIITSNSSNITIKNLINNAIINGSIGDLKILKIDNDFNNLNVTLDNSNAVIMLPSVDYNLQYKGSKSRFTHPKSTSKDPVLSFSTGNLNSPKNIVINAKYSNITMQQ
ncbi:hypothetical protein V8G56_05925 [Gaetbulibacter aquiaggeris]|uniref:Adhesin domain-containing protein n=1 Tax=Gaetbulibacter aquiaggeris TaxID=1735373 RepID=A0ABW7MN74_9FLAO